jgi:RNA polymerase sigma factor (sigma-70 family)
MSEQPVAARLSQIASRWSLIRPGSQPPDAEARNDLLVHYHEAVYHYLVAKLRDPHAAGELYSNFAVRILEEDALFRRADPNRGRFRDYLRAVLSRMVVDYYRAQARRRSESLEGDVEGDSESEIIDPDPFPQCWRQELLNQSWKTLQAVEAESGQPYATIVRLKEEMPGRRSHELAEHLSEKLGRPITAASVRKTLQRGRELFGDLLVAEVARSLKNVPDEVVPADRVEEELIDLGLLFSYCRAALERYAEKA